MGKQSSDLEASYIIPSLSTWVGRMLSGAADLQEKNTEQRMESKGKTLAGRVTASQTLLTRKVLCCLLSKKEGAGRDERLESQGGKISVKV